MNLDSRWRVSSTPKVFPPQQQRAKEYCLLMLKGCQTRFSEWRPEVPRGALLFRYHQLLREYLPET